MEEKSILVYYLIVLLKRLKLLIAVFFIVSIVAFAYAFFIVEKKYRSQLTFLPPLKESRISSVIQGLNLDMLSGASISSEQIVEIFDSKSFKGKVIEEYDLINKYKLQQHPNKFEKALDGLEEDLTLELSEIGGIGFSTIISFTIAALHTSPDTCHEIVQYAFFLLDSTVKELSIDLARREREYVEIQLKKNKSKLDSLQKDFHKFQVKNKAFDVPEQIYLSLKNYAMIRSEIMSNSIKLAALETDFQSNFYEIKRFREMNSLLNNKLNQLEKKTKPDIFPGLEISPELYADYSKYLVDLETQRQLIVFLKKELEQSKLKEARNFSSLYIIEFPLIPEYKFKPKRIYIMAIIIMSVMLFLICSILIQEYYYLKLKKNETYIRIIDAVKRSFSKKR